MNVAPLDGPMGLIDILILILATWRMASLLVEEDGPFEIFPKIRHFFGVRYDEHSISYGTNWFAKGLRCTWCVSVWAGVLWAIAYILWKDCVWVALPLALSAGAIVIQAWVERYG